MSGPNKKLDLGSPSGLIYRSAGCTHAGRVRTVNEDAFLSRPEAGLWAVADGMGGHSDGAIASQMLMNTLERLPALAALSDMVDAVDEAVLAVNDRLLSMGREHGTTIGSTFACLIANGPHAIYAWAGDSRVYLIRNRRMQQVSRDHSAVQMWIRQGLINPEQAEKHPQANRITRAVGASDPLFLEMDILLVHPGDRFLLCSDGLDKFLSASDIEGLVAIGDVGTSCETLVQATLQNGAGDNVTCLVVEASAAPRTQTNPSKKEDRRG